MKRWSYLAISEFHHPQYLTVTTTEPEMAKAIVSWVKSYVGAEITVRHRWHFRYELSKLKDKDGACYVGLIAWLCSDGWEPYAVSSKLLGGGSGGYYLRETHHFRKERQEPVGR